MKQARFDVYKARDGWRWRLIAANGRTLATGEAHSRERDARRAIKTVQLTVGMVRTQERRKEWDAKSAPVVLQ